MSNDKLYDWVFHYNHYTNEWCAFKREHYSEYFNGNHNNVIRNKSHNNLVDFILKSSEKKTKSKE